MKRIVKEAISGIVLVASFFAMILAAQPPYDDGKGALILASIVVFAVSAIALITYSRTGWSIRGSKNEWNVATAINPSGLIFWEREYRQQTRESERRDLEIERQYEEKRDMDSRK